MRIGGKTPVQDGLYGNLLRSVSVPRLGPAARTNARTPSSSIFTAGVYTHVVVHGFRVARVVGLVGAGRRVGRVRGVVVRRGRFVSVVLVTDAAMVTAVVSSCAVSQVASAGHVQDESDKCALQRK